MLIKTSYQNQYLYLLDTSTFITFIKTKCFNTPQMIYSTNQN